MAKPFHIVLNQLQIDSFVVVVATSGPPNAPVR